MAQIRLRDYKEPLTSFNHNIMQFTRKPGRFVGFDTLVQTATLGFNLAHAATGTTYKDEVQNTIGPAGVIMSTQGVFIIETATITGFTVDTNAGNTTDRVDLIVCNHQFLNLSGGQAATYSIIKGPIGNPVAAALPNPFFQTIIGRVLLPAGATDLAQCTYVKERCPDTGDGVDARLTDVNRFATFNQFNFSQTVYSNISNQETLTGSKNGWNLNEDGNSFNLDYGFANFIDAIRIGKTTVQNGAIITLQINQFSTIRNNQTIQVADILRGFASIIVPNNLANTLVTVGPDRVLAITPTDGALKWNVTLLKSDNQWIVTGVQGYSHSYLKKGMVVHADLTSQEVADNFEVDGLGKNLYLGYQMCNGLRGTMDRRCRFSVMTDQGPNAGAGALASDLLTYAINEQSTGFAAQRVIGLNNLPTNMSMTILARGIKKSGTSNGVLVIGTANVSGAGADPVYGYFNSPIDLINNGGDIPMEFRPPYTATFDLMKL
jgi:hypothetical protein